MTIYGYKIQQIIGMPLKDEHDNHLAFILEGTLTLELVLQLHPFFLCPQHLQSKKQQPLKLVSDWVKGMHSDYRMTHIFSSGAT